VNVNKPRCDQETFSLQCALGTCSHRADCDDPVTPDTDIASEPRMTGPVGNETVLDDQIEHS
jgi:hypothetical protein